jgi:hypothetical protein
MGMTTAFHRQNIGVSIHLSLLGKVSARVRIRLIIPIMIVVTVIIQHADVPPSNNSLDINRNKF